MKKLSLLSVLFFSAVSVWAAGSNIKMVSYFPVPYVSYSDLKVSNTCDVGLGNSCTLNATSLKVQSTTTATANAALNTGTVLVKEGNLELFSPNPADSVLSGTTLNVGNGSNTGNARLSVGGNLTVDGTFLHENTVTNLTSTNLATIQSLQLQGGTEGASYLTFPTCDATDNKISWANLTIGGKNGVFLVCGEGIDPIPCVPSFGPQIENLNAEQRTDTCDGDTYYRFLCVSGGEERKCWDVYKVKKYNDGKIDPNSPMLQDTCDNDNSKKYKGSEGDNCVDIYYVWENASNGEVDTGDPSCSMKVEFTNDFSFNIGESLKNYLNMHSHLEFCETYVKATTNGTCQYYFTTEGYKGTTEHHYVTCEGYYYQKTYGNAGLETYGREVQCCPGQSVLPEL